VEVLVAIASAKEAGGVISIRRVSLGGGYRYLINSVAAGDGNPEPSKGLAHYYASTGTPPGIFLGAGLADLDGGRGVEKGSQVSEEHLFNMLGELSDPVSGEPLGGRLTVPGNAAPVAGFDLTFSPSKSVSTAWALADEGTKAVIAECHREAVDYVISYAEANVFHSRSGAGGIVEEDVTGVIATSFTHFTSRLDDPQLHDHLVVWNRARSVSDGKWRTLDSKAIFKATTTLSELHQGVLSDLLTAKLGVGWEARGRRHSSKPRYEITGVAESLMAEFSRRSEQIAEHSELLRAEFKAAHGRSATAVEDMRLHAVATIATRPDKTKHSLAELTEEWRKRAASHIEKDEQIAWVSSLRHRNDLPLLCRDDLGEAILADAAQAVVTTVAEHHSTYGRQNLLAEAHRMLHGVRFASPDNRVAVAEYIAELAIARSVMLTPPPLHHTPERYVRPDGSSRLHPESQIIYTTEALLAAEARLLEAARSLGAPRVSVAVVAEVTEANMPGRDYKLSVDQALAVEKIATSGRVLDVLVGPAGTGKSTAMAGLRAVWEQVHGPGSVIGLAPSAAAARVLGDELEIDTENTAKWLTEWRRIPELSARRERLALNLARHAYPRSPSAARLRAKLAETEHAISERRLKPGQLVMIDESSLAGTFTLDELVSAAATAGSKILLLGDHAQMSSVEAGGAFSLLVKDRGDLVPELTDIRRFSSEWEKAASVELRVGNTSAIDAYEAHDRVRSGDRESLLDAVYAAWNADVVAGKSSLMIAGDSATVTELNRRARTARVAEGTVAESGLAIADGQRAGVGVEIVTRQNNRLLTTGKSWVKNGDRFVVAATNLDGSMTVRRVSSAAEVVLPADYVAQHVELGYATTSYRSQGRTVDTTHSLVSPTTTREVLYVAATRGRESNKMYVDTSFDPDPATGHDGTIAQQSAAEVLAGVFANEGAHLSAHEILERAHRHIEDFSVLAAEYETLARAAQQQRWDDLLECSGLEPGRLEQVRQSPAYGPLLAALRDAESRGLDVERTFPKLVAARPLDDAEDPASVMHDRVDRWAQGAGTMRRASANLIVGLIPRAAGVTDRDMVQALDKRDAAIQLRARELALQAVENGQVWVSRLGTPPSDPVERERWMAAVSTVAAYRVRWSIGNDHRPLGSYGAVKAIEGVNHRKRAQAAIQRARSLSEVGGISSSSQPIAARVVASQDRSESISM
jgi:conjugative relaxase-like TrwC/TraI family protein